MSAQGATVSPYGECALLLRLPPGADADAVTGWASAIRSAGLPGVLDVVPAACSVVVQLDRPGLLDRVGALVAGLTPAAGSAADSESADAETDADAGSDAVVVIPVRYDGPDLEAVAEATGLTCAGVVEAHCGSSWRVAFAGFAPGFAYLVGGDPRLHVARRAEPRTRVPAGAVALAAGFSAVYPRESPGGWQLIGTTDRAVWDLAQDPPALLTPGREVRFVAVP